MDLDVEKQITSFFKSRKLAIVLIVLIIFFSILGTHIPQKSQIKPEVYNTWEKNHPIQAEIFDFLGFNHLFSSFIFISLAALLFTNTLFCTRGLLINSIRLFGVNPQFQKQAFIGSLEKNKVIKTGKNHKEIHSAIDSALVSEGYKVEKQENHIFAQKNRTGVFGTPLFHVSILFIILAVVYGSTGRMEGDMRLIEGQTLSEDHGNYMFINEGPFFNENHKKFDISLEKFTADYIDETGTPRGPAGKLAIIENGQNMKTDIVYANHQMDFEGYTFLGNVYGMAPLLLLTNPDGSVYSGSYITATDQDESQRYVAYFDLGDTGLEGGLMVYMTAPLTTGITGSRGVEQTPILFLKIFEKGKEINDVTLELNDTVKIGDKTLGFYGIKYWSNFYVVKDNSMFLILAGSGLMTLSLFISFFIIPKRIWVEIVDTGKQDSREIHIGGKSDKFRSLYEEEFSGIVNNVEKRLSNV
ncbi:MAG TPA: cytochrome c biogenesis protein ResB [Candidatus Limnocylindrales bacterium]|nr:cytochrome c biogenesis protein ResB [Candidatus Limnocylindrales bacterium]